MYLCKANFLLQRKATQGLTLVELMVTLSLLAILMTLAVPSFNNTLASLRNSSTSNELLATMQQARSDAIRMGQRITVCSTSNGSTCSGSLDWSQGWITFVDATRTVGILSRDAGETITAVVQPVEPSIQVLTDISHVSFNPEGKTRSVTNAFVNTTIRVCNTSGSLPNDSRARDLRIVNSGLIRFLDPNPTIPLLPTTPATCPAP
jgi:type IV fimbrial biogenesis protein FimT